MAKKDLYEVLGVARDADKAVLKKAYRRLAMKHHPDRNEGDKKAEASFREAKEAYEVLTDANKRAAYDQFGHAGIDTATGAGGGGGQGASSFGDVFGDVFGDIFGSRGSASGRPARGNDLRYSLDLSLEEAVKGTTSKIRFPTQVKCGSCKGSGAKKGSSPVSCTTCGGNGQVRMQQGFFSLQQTCPTCRGAGRMIKTPCIKCHGSGRTEETKTLSVKVPPGVDTGDRIRLSGEGEASELGGGSGDLYVQINVLPHPLFKRQDNHLYCEVPVSFSTVTLGGEVVVPTLSGRVTLKVPAGTQTNKTFRMRGKGVSSVHGGATGDLLCKVVVETPVHLSKEQKTLIEELDQSMTQGKDNKHTPHLRSWMDGAKKFFEDMKL